MLFRTQIIFCSSELRLHFRIAEVGSLLSLNRAWRAQVTHISAIVAKYGEIRTRLECNLYISYKSGLYVYAIILNIDRTLNLLS